MGMSELDFKLLCEASGIRFLDRLYPSLVVERSSALKFVERCRDHGWIILGIEGFEISEDATRVLNLIADFSSVDSSSESCDEASSFLEIDEALEASHFDFTICRPCGKPSPPTIPNPLIRMLRETFSVVDRFLARK